MRLSLSANISKWRKEKGMTQEQLAEVLGVTFASVSKWERGVATPELNLIAEMADFFGVFLDALIGFKVQHNGAGELERRIFERQNEKKYVDKITAPCYGECANLSFLLGEEEKAEIYLRRAYAIAKSFDAAPVCNGANMKFQVGDDEKAVTYDDLGESVIDLVEEQLTKEDHKEILYQIWKKMIGEKHGNL